VSSIEVGKRGERFYDWRVGLNVGNDPRWIRPLIANVLLLAQKEREKAKRGVPETITIFSPGFEPVTVESQG
jgi:hypothetical protein